MVGDTLTIVVLADEGGNGLRIRRDIGLRAIGTNTVEVQSGRIAVIGGSDSTADLWAGVPLGKTPGISLLRRDQADVEALGERVVAKRGG